MVHLPSALAGPRGRAALNVFIEWAGGWKWATKSIETADIISLTLEEMNICGLYVGVIQTLDIRCSIASPKKDKERPLLLRRGESLQRRQVVIHTSYDWCIVTLIVPFHPILHGARREGERCSEGEKCNRRYLSWLWNPGLVPRAWFSGSPLSWESSVIKRAQTRGFIIYLFT